MAKELTSKVWVIQRGDNLLGVYSSKPSADFLKTLLGRRYDYLTDSGLRDLLEEGWATDGWVEWFITETEVEDCK